MKTIIPDYISSSDFTANEVARLYDLAAAYKRGDSTDIERICLADKAVAILLLKPSLRTRVTFELAVTQLGGHAVVLQQAEIGLGQREAACDIARNLERWVDGIVARVFGHEVLIELAEHAEVPVINALSDLEHPCQALADLFTLHEIMGGVHGKKLAFVGDGFNVTQSLLLLGASLGMHISVATPMGYEPRSDVVGKSRKIAEGTGAKIELTNDIEDAVRDADAVCTDVWTSMGQEDEAYQRRQDLGPFQVNDTLLQHAPDHAVVMHCLPAHRGEEITNEVLNSSRCCAFQQAENRLHTQKALLAILIGNV